MILGYSLVKGGVSAFDILCVLLLLDPCACDPCAGGGSRRGEGGMSVVMG